MFDNGIPSMLLHCIDCIHYDNYLSVSDVSSLQYYVQFSSSPSLSLTATTITCDGKIMSNFVTIASKRRIAMFVEKRWTISVLITCIIVQQ